MSNQGDLNREQTDVPLLAYAPTTLLHGDATTVPPPFDASAPVLGSTTDGRKDGRDLQSAGPAVSTADDDTPPLMTRAQTICDAPLLYPHALDPDPDSAMQEDLDDAHDGGGLAEFEMGGGSREHSFQASLNASGISPAAGGDSSRGGPQQRFGQHRSTSRARAGATPASVALARSHSTSLPLNAALSLSADPYPEHWLFGLHGLDAESCDLPPQHPRAMCPVRCSPEDHTDAPMFGRCDVSATIARSAAESTSRRASSRQDVGSWADLGSSGDAIAGAEGKKRAREAEHSPPRAPHDGGDVDHDSSADGSSCAHVVPSKSKAQQGSVYSPLPQSGMTTPGGGLASGMSEHRTMSPRALAAGASNPHSADFYRGDAAVTAALPHHADPSHPHVADSVLQRLQHHGADMGSELPPRPPLHRQHTSDPASSSACNTQDVNTAGGDGKDPASSSSEAAACRARLRVFLVRHGESATNVDPAVYRETPDHAVPLTRRGVRMAEIAGRDLRRQLSELYGSPDEAARHVRMYVSPFRRTRETAQGLLRALNDSRQQWVDSVLESPLLVEQDWGCQEGEGTIGREKYKEEIERNAVKGKHDGRFWARFPNGESSFDVCQRVQTLFPALWQAAAHPAPHRGPIKVAIIVSHGLTLRALLTMWCRYSPEWFARSWNPPNCSIQRLDGHWDVGYTFGGWRPGATLKDVAIARREEDPQRAVWAGAVACRREAPPLPDDDGSESDTEQNT